MRSPQARKLHSIEGGVLKAPTKQLCMVWSLSSDHPRLTTAYFARVWLALLNWGQTRAFKKTARQTRFSSSEVACLLGEGSLWRVEAALAHMQAQGFIRVRDEHHVELASNIEELTDPEARNRAHQMLAQMPSFEVHPGRRSPRRWFFIPRRIAAVLMRERRSKGKLACTFSHLVRSLYIRGKTKFTLRHNCYRVWVEEVFGLSRRAITTARRWLEDTLGWLVSLHSGWYTIKADWQRGCESAEEEGALSPEASARRQSQPVDNSAGGGEAAAETAPLRPQKIAETAPPTRVFSSSKRTVLNQKAPGANPHSRAPQAGFEAKSERHPSGGGGGKLTNMSRSDLASLPRLMELFTQALSRGLVRNTLMDRVAFVGSAADCLRQGKNPPAVFRYRIEKRQLHRCTDSSESRLYERVKRFLGLTGERERRVEVRSSMPELPKLSADAELVARRGGAPSWWSAERREAALIESSNRQLMIARAQYEAREVCA